MMMHRDNRRRRGKAACLCHTHNVTLPYVRVCKRKWEIAESVSHRGSIVTDLGVSLLAKHHDLPLINMKVRGTFH